jgi:hypothetical protein
LNCCKTDFMRLELVLYHREQNWGIYSICM